MIRVRMIARAVGCLLLVVCLIEAHVDFSASRVYDEFDFKGQSTVSIDGLCSGVCSIYASITPESKKLASNLLIQLPKGFISIAEVAARIDPTTNQKTPLLVNKAANLSITNLNGQSDAGPLVLYVVNGQEAIAPDAAVYEAEGLDIPIITPEFVTVMSARPFTIQQAGRQGDNPHAPQGIYATMSGVGGIEDHDSSCWPLFFRSSGTPFSGFSMEVNGPIVSVDFDKYNLGLPLPHLTAKLGITNKLRFDQSGWFGSPGAHGCEKKQACLHYLNPYRSSLYDLTSPIHAEVTRDRSASFWVQVGTNTDGLTITEADNGVAHRISGTTDHNRSQLNLHTQNWTADWAPNGTGNDYFLVQWNATTW